MQMGGGPYGPQGYGILKYVLPEGGLVSLTGHIYLVMHGMECSA